MKIVCTKNELQRCVNIAAKAVALKSPTYLLEGIRIKAEKDIITIYGSDGVLSIKCILKADVLEEGDIVIPARILCELLTKFEDCEIKIETDESSVIMECGHSRTTLRYMESDQYPDFPLFDTQDCITLFSKQLTSMINQTIFSASSSEEKPILTGILIEIEKDALKMVALDGYRLAIRKEYNQSEITDTEIVVPAKSMREVARIIPDDDTTVKVFIKERLVGFVCGDMQLVTRVLQGDYVRYKSILPADYLSRVIVNRSAFLGSLEIASILSRQSKANLINLSITGNLITVTSDSEVGMVREEVDINLTGKALDISFNARYLLDVFKEIYDEEIVLDFNTSISPCVIHPLTGDSYLYLVLPVKTNKSD
ncbi:MAG: DNA polymerase III subunit beta [Christensenellales bacterium]